MFAVPKPKKSDRIKAKNRRKAEKTDPVRIATLKRMPCIICYSYGMTQKTMTTVHHCKSGRYSQAKAPDSATLPLCDCHHQGMRFDRDQTKIAFHRSQAEWEMEYGEDTEWLPVVNDMMHEYEEY